MFAAFVALKLKLKLRLIPSLK